MDYKEIVERTMQIVRKKAKKNADVIESDKSLKEEYGIDSLAITEMVFDIEDEFGIQFDSDALAFDNLETVAKIADYVAGKLK